MIIGGGRLDISCCSKFRAAGMDRMFAAFFLFIF